MEHFSYRPGVPADIPLLAAIRSKNSGTVDHWQGRISGYCDGVLNPQFALRSRTIIVAEQGDTIVGFVAGHISRRLNCDGELQWIDVLENYRRRGIATFLLKHLSAWFIGCQAYKICVDPGNIVARQFYAKNGAIDLDEHWMVWTDIRKISHNV